MKILRSSLDLAYYKIVALNFFFGFSSLCSACMYVLMALDLLGAFAKGLWADFHQGENIRSKK